MKLLFATDRLHIPDDFSGSVQSTHSLAAGLIERGHQCEVLASVPRDWHHFVATAAHRVSGRRIVMQWTDKRAGYYTHRGVQWRFSERTIAAIASFRPDVLFLDAVRQLHALANSQLQPSCPIIVAIHDPNYRSADTALPFASNVRLLANSPHTAEGVSTRFAHDALIAAPIVDIERYRSQHYAPRYVTMITPHRDKGLDIVLAMAAEVPECHFQLVEGWPLSRQDLRELRSRIGKLPNVELRRSSGDMRPVYRTTRVLLVPSRLPETFGRVVIEAQASGIPVLATSIGALPWVVGSGGVLLPASATATEWTAELLKLLREPLHEAALRAAAHENVKRNDFNKTILLDRVEKLIREMAHRGREDG